MSTDLSKVIKYRLGSNFIHGNKYVIAIQGCTTSGKSTLANCFYEELKKNGSKPFIFNVDNFYKDQSNNKDIVTGKVAYDYDNPAAICWDSFVKAFKSIIKNEKTIKKYIYNFATKKRTVMEEENPGYDVVIVEGIFGHNIFNENIFNISEYDCYNSKKHIKKPFIPNNYNLGDFHILKIYLNLKNETILNSRVAVDSRRDQKTPEESEKMVRTFVLPSTDKWVRPTACNSSDIVLPNGTRDVHECSNVFKAISHFFGSSPNTNSFDAFLKEAISEVELSH